MTFGTGEGQKGASWVFTAPHDGHVPIAGELTSSILRSGSARGSEWCGGHTWSLMTRRLSLPCPLSTHLSPPSGSPSFSSMLWSLLKSRISTCRAQHFLCPGSNTISCRRSPFTSQHGSRTCATKSPGWKEEGPAPPSSSAMLQNSLSSAEASRASYVSRPCIGMDTGSLGQSVLLTLEESTEEHSQHRSVYNEQTIMDPVMLEGNYSRHNRAIISNTARCSLGQP